MRTECRATLSSSSAPAAGDSTVDVVHGVTDDPPGWAALPDKVPKVWYKLVQDYACTGVIRILGCIARQSLQGLV